jgi:hypothetical protein
MAFCDVVFQRQTMRGGNKSLKVLVMHSTVVAHQNFAQKVITWLQQIISKSGKGDLHIFLILKNVNPISDYLEILYGSKGEEIFPKL